MTNFKEVFEVAEAKGYKYDWRVASNDEFLQLSLIQKWLREEKNIAILVINFIKVNYGYKIIRDMNYGKLPEIQKCSFSNNWETYEEALLQGINEALKLINQKKQKHG